MKVQGLLGISLDEKEVFVVHINELFSQAGADLVNLQAGVDESQDSLEDNLPQAPTPSTKTKRSESSKHKRPHSNSSSVDLTVVKTEKDDLIMLDTKTEPSAFNSSNEHGPSSSKRRMMSSSSNPSMNQQIGAASPYITGIVQHNTDSSNPSASWDGTQPPNTHLPPVSSLAASSNNSSQLPSLEQTSASTWDPTRPLNASQISHSNQAALDKDMVSVSSLSSFRHPHLPLYVESCYNQCRVYNKTSYGFGFNNSKC